MVSVFSHWSAHLCRFPARTISESLPLDGTALVKPNAGMLSLCPLSEPEICSRGPSAEAECIQTMCKLILLPVHHGLYWWEVRSFCCSLESTPTLAIRVSLDTSQNNACYVQQFLGLSLSPSTGSSKFSWYYSPWDTWETIFILFFYMGNTSAHGINLQ